MHQLDLSPTPDVIEKPTRRSDMSEKPTWRSDMSERRSHWMRPDRRERPMRPRPTKAPLRPFIPAAPAPESNIKRFEILSSRVEFKWLLFQQMYPPKWVCWYRWTWCPNSPNDPFQTRLKKSCGS